MASRMGDPCVLGGGGRAGYRGHRIRRSSVLRTGGSAESAQGIGRCRGNAV